MVSLTETDICCFVYIQVFSTQCKLDPCIRQPDILSCLIVVKQTDRVSCLAPSISEVMFWCSILLSFLFIVTWDISLKEYMFLFLSCRVDSTNFDGLKSTCEQSRWMSPCMISMILSSLAHSQLIMPFLQVAQVCLWPAAVPLDHNQQLVLHTHTLLVVTYSLAFAMVSTQSLFDFGRLWFPVSAFHGFCMELYCWLWRWVSFFRATYLVLLIIHHSGLFAVIEMGDDINKIVNDKALMLINHQSTSDVPLIMAALDGRTRNIMWIMDRMFMKTNFGLVSWFHKDFFISSVCRLRAWHNWR